MQMYEVLSPLGEPTVAGVASAPRLSDWRGKTICEISNGLFRSDVSFPLIRELLRKRYPDIKVIPYSEFPIQDRRGTTEQLHRNTDVAAALAIQKGCDAVISGNGF